MRITIIKQQPKTPIPFLKPRFKKELPFGDLEKDKDSYWLNLGEKKELDLWQWRKALGNAFRSLAAKEKILGFRTDDEALARSAIQLAYLAPYRFSLKSKKETKQKFQELVLVTSIAPQRLRREAIIASYVIKARDIINLPSNIATPSYLAQYAKQLAKPLGITVKVLPGTKFPLLYAVGKGSKEKPVMVVMEWKPRGVKEKPLVLVGKGITYDSGGIAIKPTLFGNYLRTMKIDMAGASAVMHAIAAAAALKIKKHIIAITPLAENMPSGSAYKVDDVITSFSGKTVEIVHTDAEGRLILADALALGAKYKPKAMVDIATLTGAALYATGPKIVPIMGTNRQLVEQIKQAASRAFEKVWELPLEEEYEEELKSEIADVKNLNETKNAGTIIGGLFLKQFTDNVPWAHIDIGVTGWVEKPDEETSYGANAKGTRTLIEWILH